MGPLQGCPTVGAGKVSANTRPKYGPREESQDGADGGWDNSSAEEPPCIETRGLVTELVSETVKQRSEAGTPKIAREARHSHASEYRVSDT